MWEGYVSGGLYYISGSQAWVHQCTTQNVNEFFGCDAAYRSQCGCSEEHPGLYQRNSWGADAASVSVTHVLIGGHLGSMADWCSTLWYTIIETMTINLSFSLKAQCTVCNPATQRSYKVTWYAKTMLHECTFYFQFHVHQPKSGNCINSSTDRHTRLLFCNMSKCKAVIW